MEQINDTCSYEIWLETRVQIRDLKIVEKIQKTISPYPKMSILS